MYRLSPSCTSTSNTLLSVHSRPSCLRLYGSQERARRAATRTRATALLQRLLGMPVVSQVESLAADEGHVVAALVVVDRCALLLPHLEQ